MTFFYILLSCFLISLFALVGIITLSLKKKFLSKILLSLVAFSSGTLMGGAFFHLLPESLEEIEEIQSFIILMFSFSLFYLVEKLFHWRHCHKPDCKIHSFGYINLIGDAIHNFIDGLVIAAAFLTDVKLGVITSIAIASHEIPQEIGDFAVLIYAKMKIRKALLLNFLAAVTVILGGFAGFFIESFFHDFHQYLLPFAAGGFIYIAASDLLPVVRMEKDKFKSFISYLLFLLGVILMYYLQLNSHGHEH